MLDAGCSMLDTGCSMLDAGRWFLVAGCFNGRGLKDLGLRILDLGFLRGLVSNLYKL
jgi:hypothetical protein